MHSIGHGESRSLEAKYSPAEAQYMLDHLRRKSYVIESDAIDQEVRNVREALANRPHPSHRCGCDWRVTLKLNPSGECQFIRRCGMASHNHPFISSNFSAELKSAQQLPETSSPPSFYLPRERFSSISTVDTTLLESERDNDYSEPEDNWSPSRHEEQIIDSRRPSLPNQDFSKMNVNEFSNLSEAEAFANAVTILAGGSVDTINK